MQRKTLLLGGGLMVGAAVLSVVAVAALPTLLRGRVAAALQTAANENLEADCTFGTVNVSLLRTFPRLGVHVTDVSVVGQEPFAGIPLAKIAAVDLELNLRTVLSGSTVEVRGLTFQDPQFQIVVLEDGRINTDIVVVNEPKDAVTEAPPTDWNLELDDLVFNDLDLSYYDRQGDIHVSIVDLDTRSKGDLSQTVSRFVTTTTIGAMTVETGGVGWLRDTKWSVDATVDYDAATGGMTFGENKVLVNALLLGFRGSVVPSGDDWIMDLGFETKDTAFSTLLSLVPSAYTESFAGVETSGVLGLLGTANGKYASTGDHLPAFDVAIHVADARFKYPDLPTSVENIGLDLKITHPEGATDLTEIDLSRLAFSAAGATMTGVMKVSNPTTDALVDAKFAGRVDLGAVATALPQAEGTTMPTGILDVDVAFGGRQSDFVAPNVEKIRASGTVRGENLKYDGLAVPIVVTALDLALSPQRAELRKMTSTFGDKSDLSATGHFDNLLGYGMSDGILTGELAITSKYLDLRPFEGADEAEETPAPEGEDAIVAVPTNLAITITADMGQVVTSMLSVEQASGKMRVEDGAVRLDPMKATMLGGEATITGTYAAPTANEAKIDLSVNAARFDLGQSLAMFETLAQIAPVLVGASGRYDTGLSMSTKLLRDGSPDLSILSSAGSLSPSGVVLRPKALGEVGNKLGNEKLSTLDIGGTTVKYAFDNGRVEIQPVSVKLGTVPAKLRGSAGVLDRTLDMVIDVKVPTKMMSAAPVLANVQKAIGSSADVTAHITGTWDAPRVEVGLQGVESVVEAVKEVVGKAIDDLVAAARLQGDKLVAEAEKQAEKLRVTAKTAGAKLRAEAKTQGDKLVREAKGNPIKEIAAKEGAKALTSEADKAAKRGESKADEAATAVVAEARKKKDQLIADAEKKMKASVR